MIEKKSIEPGQLERFEASLRLSRDVAAKQVEQYKADDNVIGQMLAGERLHAYTAALHELLLSTNGAFGEEPTFGEVKSGE